MHPGIGKADKVNKLTNATACCVFTDVICIFILVQVGWVGDDSAVLGKGCCCVVSVSGARLMHMFSLLRSILKHSTVSHSRVEF